MLAMVFVLALGVAAFVTVAPMQMKVMQAAGEAGSNLASSLNIAAFNLGNALGAWAGGAVIAQSLGLLSLGWVAAGLTVVGLGLVFISQRHQGGAAKSDKTQSKAAKTSVQQRSSVA